MGSGLTRGAASCPAVLISPSRLRSPTPTLEERQRPMYMVVSRCRGIGPPSSGIILGTLFLLAADLRRNPT